MANVDVRKEQVDAQVSPAAPEGTPDKVDVLEISASYDEPVLDPQSEDAVIIPEAGRGRHAFDENTFRQDAPEDVFGKSASKSGSSERATTARKSDS